MTGDGEARGAARVRCGVLAAALTLAPAAALAWLGWTQRWVAEDAFIYLRVVQHLLWGHGPVFSVGERVEVYTSPLWLGLLAAAGTLGRWVPLEWSAVGLGLLLSTAGLGLAARGAGLLGRAEGRRGLALPLGALVVVALPPYWEFATSGLEMGLVFGWLGACFWGLARVHLARVAGSARGVAWLAALVGLGPLVRPDLGLFSIGFFGLLLLLAPARGVGAVARLLAAAGALPVAYQVFRMGYFAALVPNPALAKSAFAAHWEQGWRYLQDVAEPYWLWVPLTIALGWWVLDLAGYAGRGAWRAAALLAAPVALGVLHAAYIVRVGGDFMHARLLLPGLFAMLLPVAVVAGTRPWHAPLAVVVLLPWAGAAALWLAPPYDDGLGPHGVGDERGYYVSRTGSSDPVVLADYALHRFALEGHRLRDLAWRQRVVLLGRDPRALRDPDWQATPARSVRADVVVGRVSIGVRGYAAGLRVHVVDRLGLADPIAARLEVDDRGRPGHEKYPTDAWIAARFAEPGAPVWAELAPARDVAAARAALACPPLRELLDAVGGRLTADRFLRNVTVASRLHRLAIPPDPTEAAAALCGPAGGGTP